MLWGLTAIQPLFFRLHHSVADGVVSKDQAEDLVCVCGVFIHPEAADDKK